ncbi:MAG: acyl carrier protein, partial [Christensenellales bacterium]
MTFEKVRNIICNQLGKPEDKVTLESSIVEDLGADSLDVVEML